MIIIYNISMPIARKNVRLRSGEEKGEVVRKEVDFCALTVGTDRPFPAAENDDFPDSA